MADQPKSPRDEFIAQQIERQIAPFVPITPPALLQTMREGLEDTLRTYPPAIALIDQLVAQAAPVRTVEGLQEGAAGDAEDAEGKEVS